MGLAKRLSIRSGLSLPAMAAPMFLCSGVDLAIACCKAGIVGSLTRNHCRDIEELEAQLRAVRSALDTACEARPGRSIGPLAVNISPTFSQDEFRDHLAHESCNRLRQYFLAPIALAVRISDKSGETAP